MTPWGHQERGTRTRHPTNAAAEPSGWNPVRGAGLGRGLPPSRPSPRPGPARSAGTGQGRGTQRPLHQARRAGPSGFSSLASSPSRTHREGGEVGQKPGRSRAGAFGRLHFMGLGPGAGGRARPGEGSQAHCAGAKGGTGLWGAGGWRGHRPEGLGTDVGGEGRRGTEWTASLGRSREYGLKGNRPMIRGQAERPGLGEPF